MLNVVPKMGGEEREAHRKVRLWVRLVGDFEAQLEDGTSVLPISKKARCLFSLICAHMPHAIRRDVAAAMLWSSKPKEHAANSLRQALRDLQLSLAAGGLPALLMTGGGRLSMQGDCVWVDIHDPAAIKWKPHGDGTVGPLLLCQNIQGLDPAFDAYLERLWKNLVFQQAFVPNEDERLAMFPRLSAASFDQGAGQTAFQVQAPGRVASTSAAAGGSASRAVDLAPRGEDGAHGQGWRIAVLPFRSLGSQLDGGLSLGLAEEISAALARFRMPRLIATGSFWDGQGPTQDALSRCRAYNLDYVISGTIQASGPRIRVTVTLLDVAMDFEVIWASRFEGTTEDLFTLQDTIASQTVAQIDPELLQRHQFRNDPTQTASASAHQAVLTAIQAMYRPDKSRFMLAKDLLQQAIGLDSEYAAAHAWLAYWYILAIAEDWIDDPGKAASRAGEAAETAVALDPLDARGVTIAGHVKAYLLHDIEAALALHRRAITLNPNLPIAWTLSAWAHIYSGDHQTALNHATMAESLSPTDPHVFVVEHAAMTARFFMGDLEIADLLAASVLERRPRHATALRVRLAVLGHLGRLDDAAICLETLTAISSSVSLKRITARPPLRERDRDFYAEGLRLAGVVD